MKTETRIANLTAEIETLTSLVTRLHAEAMAEQGCPGYQIQAYGKGREWGLACAKLRYAKSDLKIALDAAETEGFECVGAISGEDAGRGIEGRKDMNCYQHRPERTSWDEVEVLVSKSEAKARIRTVSRWAGTFAHGEWRTVKAESLEALKAQASDEDRCLIERGIHRLAKKAS